MMNWTSDSIIKVWLKRTINCRLFWNDSVGDGNRQTERSANQSQTFLRLRMAELIFLTQRTSELDLKIWPTWRRNATIHAVCVVTIWMPETCYFKDSANVQCQSANHFTLLWLKRHFMFMPWVLRTTCSIPKLHFVFKSSHLCTHASLNAIQPTYSTTLPYSCWCVFSIGRPLYRLEGFWVEHGNGEKWRKYKKRGRHTITQSPYTIPPNGISSHNVSIRVEKCTPSLCGGVRKQMSKSQIKASYTLSEIHPQIHKWKTATLLANVGL